MVVACTCICPDIVRDRRRDGWVDRADWTDGRMHRGGHRWTGQIDREDILDGRMEGQRDLGMGGQTDTQAETCCYGDGSIKEDSSFFVDEPGMPTAIGAIIGALVGISFMTVFDMVSDTLLYCFGFDSKSGRVANTAPRAFRELLHDHDH